jgi:hypothetical protein
MVGANHLLYMQWQQPNKKMKLPMKATMAPNNKKNP